MAECTCPDTRTLLAAVIAGEPIDCERHAPAPLPAPEAVALNSDRLTQSIASALGIPNLTD